MMEYKIVSIFARFPEPIESVRMFEKMVNEHLTRDWVPCGGLSTHVTPDGIGFLQAMVKYPQPQPPYSMGGVVVIPPVNPNVSIQYTPGKQEGQ